MVERMDDFLDIYKKIEMSSFTNSEIAGDVELIKKEAKQLINDGLLSSSDIDFESNEKFLQSVKKFVDTMLAQS